MARVFQVFSSRLNKFGGVKRHCINLCALFQNDKEIFVTILSDKAIGYLAFTKKAYLHISVFYKEIKAQNYDVIHIHGFVEFSAIQAIIIAKILGKKVIYSPHYHPVEYLQHPFLGKLFFTCLLRPLLPFVSAIITISEIDTAFFRKYHRNVIQIPHYYDKQCSQINSQIQKKKNMILFVGRNEENKGIDYLYKLPSKYVVHCVTKGNLQRSDFIVHSDVSDEELDLLYREASLVVIPSRYEAFSYVALEAFAHGTPVVMSDRVQIANYLEGKSGYSIFSYGDYQDFLSAVDKTIGIDVDVNGILSIFDKNVIKNKYANIYKQVAKET